MAYNLERRTIFENSRWVYDLLPRNPAADPECSLCRGIGVVDSGEPWAGGSLVNCNICWLEQKGVWYHEHLDAFNHYHPSDPKSPAPGVK